jgi:hypothetical protein
MATFEELNALSADELHDRAVQHALKHADIKFFFDLLEALPAAEVVAGDVDRASADIFKVSALVLDLFRADDGKLAEALRPFYIDYLLEHDA